jgi:amino acid transporter
MLLVNGFKNFIPGQFNILDFLVAYVGIPIFAVFYFGHRVTVGRSHPWVMHPKDMDLVTGLDEVLASFTNQPWSRIDGT